ncbi:MAG: hypothetical protein ACRC62_38050 [Microcoleus sp.]
MKVFTKKLNVSYIDVFLNVFLKVAAQQLRHLALVMKFKLQEFPKNIGSRGDRVLATGVIIYTVRYRRCSNSQNSQVPMSVKRLV